jgi:hypothetical protein
VDDVCADIAQALGHPAADERDEPAEEGGHDERDAQDVSDEEGGQDEEEPEGRHEPALRRRVVDLDFYGVAGGAGEAGKRVRSQEQVSVDVGLVADEGGHEAVEGVGCPARDEGREPADQHHNCHRVAPERRPDEVGQREQDAEEHGQT